MFGLSALSSVKWIGYLVLVATIFGGGFYSGTLYQEHEDQNKVDKIETDLQATVKDLADTKLAWEAAKTMAAQAKAEATAAVNKAILDNAQKVREAEDAAQAKIVQATAKFNSQLKKVKDEADAALNKVLHPVLSADPVDDGLWVDAYNCSGASATGGDTMSQATSGTIDQPIRCRLHPQTAERLIQSATAANQVVEELNMCVESLKVLSPQSFAAPPGQ